MLGYMHSENAMTGDSSSSAGMTRTKVRNQQRLLDALKRLQARCPTVPALQEALTKGERLVTFTNVALEAGLSRGLIAHQRCAYPAVRAAVSEQMRADAETHITPALVAELRATVRDLEKRLANRDAYNAELAAENTLLRKQLGNDTPTAENVVSFRRDHRRKEK